MTLLELLKEHLKEWPIWVRAYSQDSDGTINENRTSQVVPVSSSESEEPDSWTWICGEWWIADDPVTHLIWRLPVADDASTAIVTREMWEAA